MKFTRLAQFNQTAPVNPPTLSPSTKPHSTSQATPASLEAGSAFTGAFRRLAKRWVIGLLLLLLPSMSAWAATLTFTVNAGSPATTYPAVPYTGFSEYFSTLSTVKITCSDGSAQIRYTVDGTTPTLSSPTIANNGTLPVGGKFTLSAKAWSGGVEVASQTTNYHATGMIAAGANHALALPSRGNQAWAWGENANRQLGYFWPTISVADQSSKIVVTYEYPNTILGSSTSVSNSIGVKAIAAGRAHSIALMNDGTIRAWGNDTYCQLGDALAPGESPSYTHPYINAVRNSYPQSGFPSAYYFDPSYYLTGVTSIASGSDHCLAIVGGKVYAWGRNNTSQLGLGSPMVGQNLDIAGGPLVTALGTGQYLSDIVNVAGGDGHSAALHQNGDVYTWGSNSNGQVLGTATTTARIDLPQVVSSFSSVNNPAKARAIACGDDFTLVVRNSDGTVWGWGYNAHGELGNLTTATSQRVPVQVKKFSNSQPLNNIVSLEAGTNHSLALDANGQVWAWGSNVNGRLGDGTTTQKTGAVPVTISGFVIAIAAGGDFSMALTEDGKIFTWGNAASGRLGNAATSGNFYTPTTSSYLPVVANRPPVISSFSVGGTDSRTQPATLNLTVSVTDPDNDVQRVDFYTGTTLLGSATSSPWTISPLLSAGNYSFLAIATDSAGATGSGTSSENILYPSLSVSTPVGTIPEAGGNPGHFVFTLNKAQLAALPINLSLNSSSTASSGVDFQSLPTNITMPAGETSLSLDVTPIQDLITEPDETITINIGSSTGYTIAGSGAATINLSDSLTVAITPLNDGFEDTSYGTAPGKGWFRITRSQASTSPLSVLFAISGSATQGSDYATVLSTSVTIPAGATSADVAITPIKDDFVESPKSVILTLQTSNTYNIDSAHNAATIYIRDFGPGANDMAVTCPAESPKQFDLEGYVPDFPFGENVTAQITQLPVFGTVVVGSGETVTYTPNAGAVDNPAYNGQDTFRYRVQSGGLWSSEAVVTIKLSPLRTGFDPNASDFSKSVMDRGDDNYTESIPLGFTINFFGTPYSSAYLNNNGNMTFDIGNGSYTPDRIVGSEHPIIAPFWADVDTRVENVTLSASYGAFTVDQHSAFALTWTKCNYFVGSGNPSGTKINTFQVVLIDRSTDTGITGDVDIEFNYSQIQWETGSARLSHGIDGLADLNFPDTAPHVGMANGTTGFELAGSGDARAFLDSGTKALSKTSRESHLPGRYIFRLRNGQLANAPAIFAGADRTVANNVTAVTINDSTSQPSTGVIYKWEEVNFSGPGLYTGSDPAAVISGDTTLHPTITLPTARPYRFRLTVDDGVNEVSTSVKVIRSP